MMKKENKKHEDIKNMLIRVMAILIIVLGLLVCLYPYICSWKHTADSEKRIREFQKMTKKNGQDFLELRRRMESYNRQLYEEGQSGLKDAFSYEQSSIDLEQWGLTKDMVGYIDIPKIHVRLPVYLGANKENMKKGAAHMSQTSLPIGGENTNCVLAGHRGYAKAAMFRDLNLLKTGDRIYLTNLWETRCYRVCERKVILPDDTEQILIQDGKDLVTLITCHPFRHNYQRLVVYCEYEK